MTLFIPFIKPVLLTCLSLVVLFFERSRLRALSLPLLALLWILNLVLWSGFSWFHDVSFLPGALEPRAWEGLFLGLNLGSYIMLLARIAYAGEPDRKVEQLFFKAALLLGLITMTLVNFRSFELGFILYVAVTFLAIPLMYQHSPLREYFNLHVMVSLTALLALLLGYNQVMSLDLLHWLQSSVLLITFILQYIIIRRVVT